MGGGGSSSPSNRDLRTLGELARQSLRSASEAGKRNVFISFAAEDLNAVNLLRGQAKNDNAPFEFNDWSLREPFNSERAEYIRSGIRARIKQASVTFVYLTEHTAGSEWVDWEIRESVRQRKKVIGIYQGQTPPTKLPQAVTEHNIKLIRWSYDEIERELE